jgi:cell division protein ZapA
MPEIHLTLNGRSYPVSCEEGEETRIKELAQYVDRKIQEFVSKLGQIGEARLLVLAALVVADELADAHAALRRQSTTAANGVDTETLAHGLDELAKRIETIAVRLETSHIAP